MKKLLFLFIITFASNVMSQTLDTIYWDQRRPDLYYWGSNWIDSSVMANPTSYLLYDSFGGDVTINWGDCFYGRPCVTMAPMRVIGIAAPVRIGKYIGSYTVLDTVIANRLPEYFRLYQHEGDSIYFVAETRWDTATPQQLFQINYGSYHNGITIMPPLKKCYKFYEAYFDKPITVHDTFYVGGTTHNNITIGNNSEYFPGSVCYPHHNTSYNAFKVEYSWDGDASNGVWSSGIFPNPSYYIVKYFNSSLFLYPYPSESSLGTVYDTNKIYIAGTQSGGNFVPDKWLPFFAIFDTNFVPGLGTYSDSCLAPTGLHLEGMNKADSSVTLAWNAGGETMWKLSVAPVGVNVNEGLILESYTNYLQVSGLDTSTWYVARVLAMCDTDVFGDWSDTVMFIIGTPPPPPPEPDTTTCPKPEGFQLWSTDVGSAVLVWDQGEVQNWELELAPAGTPLGEGEVTSMTLSFKMYELDTAAWYWARLRTVCGADWYSNWTDTLLFYVPGNGGGQSPDDSNNVVAIVEQYTYLMPNPAREEVTVMSSFKVRSVELYASDGKLLKEQEVNALGTRLSLEGLPAGVYFVRVRTSAGVTTKRLVIE